YAEVQKGIGVHKTPDKYGAFPIDPYSHTPRMAGVQQPGMTGQVKEDVISRFFELGVSVKDGQITFKPIILKKDEFIKPGTAGSHDQKYPHIYFTYCSVPVIYLLDNEDGIELIRNGNTQKISGNKIDKAYSHSIFNREGSISKVVVHIKSDMVL